MNILRLLPVFISFLLLAAHFIRAGQTILALVSLLILIPLFFRKHWVPWVTQLALLLGALEWLRTLFFIAQMRIEFGMPWIRMAIILGAVTLFTTLSGLVFRSKALRERHSPDKSEK
jgi:hypothetical protein